MSSTPSLTWRHLLNQKGAAFLAHAPNIPSTITSEDTFLTYFENLCRKHREGYYDRLCAKLKLGRVDAFASPVDESFDHGGSSTLAGLMLGCVFVAFQCGINADIPLADAAQYLGELNALIPPLKADIAQYAAHQKLVSTLELLFSTYMDTLTLMVSNFNLRLDRSELHKRLDSVLEASVVKFEKGRTAFASFIQEMEHMAQQDAIFTPSTTSGSYLDNASSAYQPHPYDTHMQYKAIRRLGRGSSGDVDEVEEVTKHSPAQRYARKRIVLTGTSESQRTAVLHEVEIMKTLRHQHIASICFPKLETDSCSIFMQPVADGDLWQYLEVCTEKGFEEVLLQPVLKWFGCLLDALAFAHTHDVIHRDVKPSNILIKNEQVFLADFGIAKVITYGSSDPSSHSQRGTTIYRAPVVKNNVSSEKEGDVFSLGCVFSEMLSIRGGKTLDAFRKFREVHTEENDRFAFLKNLPKVRSWVEKCREESNFPAVDDLSDQILRMLTEDPKRRKTAQRGVAALRDHAWCERNYIRSRSVHDLRGISQ